MNISVRRVAPAALALLATLMPSASARADVTVLERPAERMIVVVDRGVDPAVVAAPYAAAGANLTAVYRQGLWGFAATLPPQVAPLLERDPAVRYVERDVLMPAAGRRELTPWGVRAILGDRFHAARTRAAAGGSGPRVYVVDTGIDPGHGDLRVRAGVSLQPGSTADCQGHGTHVAGTIGARRNGRNVVGIVPGVQLTAVRVLDCSANARSSMLIEAIDWAIADAGGRPGVVNLSLTGTANRAVDEALLRGVAAGLTFVVAAGNDGVDACDRSPGRAGEGRPNGIITVAAVDRGGRHPAWSNDGSCVDVWAPGVAVRSTRLGGGSELRSGTSTAAPHVAGLAARYLRRRPGVAPAEVEAAVFRSARHTGDTAPDGRAVRIAGAGGLRGATR